MTRASEDPHRRARAAMARGDAEGAARDLALAAAAETHLAERDYVALLRPLEEALTRAGDYRGALTVLGYEAIGRPAAWTRARALLPKVPPADRARAAAAQGHAADAAREMEDAGRVAAAAIFREGTADFAGARALWSRLTLATDDDRYVAALVRLNIARCAKRCGDAAGAREALVASTRLLEEAADHFEGIGQSERAFDCFQVLTQVGRESGAFEDMLEGFVNCIRILREDHLGTFALEYFEEAIATAAERGEASAASTFARDAANYARSQGLASTANGYSLLQAELWQAAAKQHQGRGGPVDIVENALLAAVLAYGEVGQHARVGALYAELATLKLAPARREQYERAKERYVDAEDEELEASRPKRPEANISDVWHADVLEWEQRGSASEVCADVLLDKRWPDLIRRRAMLARLTALDVEAKEALEPAASLVNARVRMAERLSELQEVYAVLAPLEALFARPEGRVRVAAVLALQSLYFKRTFVTVRAALRDPDAAVVEQGAATVKALHFPHAFHPLARIVRESQQPSVRAAALWGIAQIDTVEAAEFLLGVLDNGAPVDQAAARGAAMEARGTTLAEVFRQAMHGAGAGLKANLAEVMKGWKSPG